jgi:hypothetical protein
VRGQEGKIQEGKRTRKKSIQDEVNQNKRYGSKLFLAYPTGGRSLYGDPQSYQGGGSGASEGIRAVFTRDGGGAMSRRLCSRGPLMVSVDVEDHGAGSRGYLVAADIEGHVGRYTTDPMASCLDMQRAGLEDRTWRDHHDRPSCGNRQEGRGSR